MAMGNSSITLKHRNLLLLCLGRVLAVVAQDLLVHTHDVVVLRPASHVGRYGFEFFDRAVRFGGVSSHHPHTVARLSVTYIVSLIAGRCGAGFATNCCTVGCITFWSTGWFSSVTAVCCVLDSACVASTTNARQSTQSSKRGETPIL